MDMGASFNKSVRAEGHARSTPSTERADRAASRVDSPQPHPTSSTSSVAAIAATEDNRAACGRSEAL